LQKKIVTAATLAGERAAKEGIDTARANEAGNQIEPFVRAAIREVGLAARIPLNTAGTAQVTGYPDVEITGATPCYLELKTYNATRANTTQRTFIIRRPSIRRSRATRSIFSSRINWKKFSATEKRFSSPYIGNWSRWKT
jgi:hypothetical protein